MAGLTLANFFFVVWIPKASKNDAISDYLEQSTLHHISQPLAKALLEFEFPCSCRSMTRWNLTR